MLGASGELGELLKVSHRLSSMVEHSICSFVQTSAIKKGATRSAQIELDIFKVEIGYLFISLSHHCLPNNWSNKLITHHRI